MSRLVKRNREARAPSARRIGRISHRTRSSISSNYVSLLITTTIPDLMSVRRLSIDSMMTSQSKAINQIENEKKNSKSNGLLISLAIPFFSMEDTILDALLTEMILW